MCVRTLACKIKSLIRNSKFPNKTKIKTKEEEKTEKHTAQAIHSKCVWWQLDKNCVSSIHETAQWHDQKTDEQIIELYYTLKFITHMFSCSIYWPASVRIVENVQFNSWFTQQCTSKLRLEKKKTHYGKRSISLFVWSSPLSIAWTQ